MKTGYKIIMLPMLLNSFSFKSIVSYLVLCFVYSPILKKLQRMSIYFWYQDNNNFAPDIFLCSVFFLFSLNACKCVCVWGGYILPTHSTWSCIEFPLWKISRIYKIIARKSEAERVRRRERKSKEWWRRE